MFIRICKIVFSASACPCLSADVIRSSSQRLRKVVGWGRGEGAGCSLLESEQSAELELLTCRLFGWDMQEVLFEHHVCEKVSSIKIIINLYGYVL